MEGKGKANEVDHLVGNRLKQKRLMLNMSQEYIAKKADVSTQQVQKYEKGKNRISSGMLYKLSKILDSDIDYFFEEGGANILREPDQKFSFAVDAKKEASESELELLSRYFKILKDANLREKIIDLVKLLSKLSY
jgi:transcriptional regulator with XRE-family HTH domain